MVSLVDCLRNLVSVNMPYIIAGDLNCNAVDWIKLLAPSDGMQDVITNFVVKKWVHIQTATEPTRGNNILDIVLCNEPLSVFNTAVLPPLGSRDHCQAEFSVLVDNDYTDNVYSSAQKTERWYDWAMLA